MTHDRISALVALESNLSHPRRHIDVGTAPRSQRNRGSRSGNCMTRSHDLARKAFRKRREVYRPVLERAKPEEASIDATPSTQPAADTFGGRRKR